MDNDYYHSSDYKIQLNEEPVESTPYNGGLDNISEMPAPALSPTPTPINDTQSNSSSCPIERPYYEINESIQKSETIQHNNCCIRCLDRYDDINVYFITIFLIVFIQFFFITILYYAIFYFDIYELYIKKYNRNLFLINNLISCFLFYGIFCMKGSFRRSKALYIYIVLYIPSILFNCFYFSKFTEIKYIFIVLITILIDYFSILFFIIIFTSNGISFMIAPVFTSFALMITFHFLYHLSTAITIKISSIALSGIIYIIIISKIIYTIETEDYLFATIIMDYGIFWPLAFTILLIVYLISLILSNLPTN